MDTFQKPVSSQARTVFCHGNRVGQILFHLCLRTSRRYRQGKYLISPRVTSDAGRNSLSGVRLLLQPSTTGVLSPCRPNTWADLGSTLCGVGVMGWTPALTPENSCSGFGQRCSLPGSQYPTKLFLPLNIWTLGLPESDDSTRLRILKERPPRQHSSRVNES